MEHGNFILVNSNARTMTLASELSARVAPLDETARLQLTAAISQMCDVITTASGDMALRLKAASSATALPITTQSVWELLLAQPGEQMDAAALRARFAPGDEVQRQHLLDVVSELADLVSPKGTDPCAGLLVRLRRAAGLPAAIHVGSSTRCTAAHRVPAVADTDPITSAERELVCKVLAAHPGGLRADDLSRMVALGGGGAKRRVARIVAAVAYVAQQPDASGAMAPVLFLREACSTMTSGEGGSHLSSAPTCQGTSLVSSMLLPSCTSVRAHEPTVVSEELVVGLLRANGGRMPTHSLITELQPLDAHGKRALAAVVQRVAKTILPDCTKPHADDAQQPTVVLREVLLAAKVESRAASVVQRRQRERRVDLCTREAAAIRLQMAVRACAARRQWECAATLVQSHTRRLLAVRRTTTERESRCTVPMLQAFGRWWLLALRMAARERSRHLAAVRLQAEARRTATASVCNELRRDEIIARETPKERETRVERERTQLLRKKLLRRCKKLVPVLLGGSADLSNSGESSAPAHSATTPAAPQPHPTDEVASAFNDTRLCSQGALLAAVACAPLPLVPRAPTGERHRVFAGTAPSRDCVILSDGDHTNEPGSLLTRLSTGVLDFTPPSVVNSKGIALMGMAPSGLGCAAAEMEVAGNEMEEAGNDLIAAMQRLVVHHGGDLDDSL